MPGQYGKVDFRASGAHWRGFAAGDAAGFAALCGKLDGPGAVLCKDRPKITAGNVDGYFVKRCNLPGLLTQLRRRLRTPRPWRALTGARQLAALGIDTPVVFAALTETRIWVRREFLVTAALGPETEFFNRALDRGASPETIWRKLMEDVLPLLVRLHDSGWTHGDANLRNVYMRPDGRCGMVDLDGMRRCRGGVAARFRAGETARLVSSFMICARETGDAAERCREAAERYTAAGNFRLDAASVRRAIRPLLERGKRYR